MWEFPKLGVPYFGDLMLRILLFNTILGPLFSETPMCIYRSSARGFKPFPLELQGPKNVEIHEKEASARSRKNYETMAAYPKTILQLPYFSRHKPV